jgi:hypothetical protein
MAHAVADETMPPYADGMARPGARKQDVVDQNREAFGEQWPLWTSVLQRIEQAGLALNSMQPQRTADRRSSWLALTSPKSNLIQHFELAPEVLVLLSPWKEIQATDIKRAEEAFRDEVRLDPGFVLVITGDPDAASRLGTVVPDHRRYIFLSSDVLEKAQNAEALLRQRLRDALGRRRLFDARGPATGPQFFGRDQELEALERDLRKGHCMGLFGLRKVGKTSLVRRLAQKLRETRPLDTPTLVVELDLLALPWNQQHRNGVVSAIAHRLAREQNRVWVPGSVDGQQALLTAIESARSQPGSQVLVILDEYEKLFGPTIPVRDGLAILDWLRGLAQAHAGTFSFMLVGRNSRLLAPARIEGVDNPMYRFLRSVPLSGLAAEECRAMVRKLGRRMGLAFTYGALDHIANQTGGHAALARTLGDLIDQSIPTETRDPAPVTPDHIERVKNTFSLKIDEDMRELVNAALDFDAQAEEFLKHLAHGVPWRGDRVEDRLRDALTEYGVLEESGEFRIKCFGDWLRENYALVGGLAHA